MIVGSKNAVDLTRLMDHSRASNAVLTKQSKINRKTYFLMFLLCEGIPELQHSVCQVACAMEGSAEVRRANEAETASERGQIRGERRGSSGEQPPRCYSGWQDQMVLHCKTVQESAVFGWMVLYEWWEDTGSQK